MKFTVALLAFVMGQAAATPVEQTLDAPSLFDKFKAQFNKKYEDAAEELKRFKIFVKNIEHVAQLKLNDPSAHYSVLTPFADETQEDFANRNGFSASIEDKMSHAEELMAEAPLLKVGDLPTAYDAREKGLVTPVKNQAQCGSCWAFATVANIEGQNMLQNGKLVSFSEQELVDCSKSDFGCNGGLPVNAYKDMIKNKIGLEKEEDYAYKAVTDKCEAVPSKEMVFLSGYKTISTDEEQIAMALMQYGPLAIGLNAAYMQLYAGGVSDPWMCSPSQIDHGVTIVAFGVDEDSQKPYWDIKNSWGDSWGMKGYYRIVRGKGKCGLNTMVSSAIVAKSSVAEPQLFI